MRNAFATYDGLPGWQASSQADLLAAHGLLMQGLLLETVQSDQLGDQVNQLLHALPPGVALSSNELMQWLGLSHGPTFSKKLSQARADGGVG